MRNLNIVLVIGLLVALGGFILTMRNLNDMSWDEFCTLLSVLY